MKTQTSLTEILSNDKANIAIAIIGLIANIISISTFIYQIWQPPTLDPIDINISVIIRAFLILFYCYSWGILSWILARRNFNSKRLEGGIYTKSGVDTLIEKTVTGIGIVIAPITTFFVSIAVYASYTAQLIPKEDLGLTIMFVLLGSASHLWVGFLLIEALKALMPVIYSDMYQNEASTSRRSRYR